MYRIGTNEARPYLRSDVRRAGSMLFMLRVYPLASFCAELSALSADYCWLRGQGAPVLLRKTKSHREPGRIRP